MRQFRAVPLTQGQPVNSEDPAMSATHMSTDHVTDHTHPWVEVTEPSDGHVMPFVTGVLLFAVAAIVSILLSGLPQ